MADDLTDARVDAFLEELSELSRRHGIAISGCGCCESPELQVLRGEGPYRVGRGGYEPYGCLEWVGRRGGDDA